MTDTTQRMNEDPNLTLPERHLLDSISRMPLIDSAELTGILGEAHATVHRGLTGLLADGIVGRVSHGTAHLPSSQRDHLTANGIREAAELLGFAPPSDFVRAYPVSREWLGLLISAGWTRWPPSTVSPPHSPPASTASGRTWSSTAWGTSTPPSPSTDLC